MNLFTKQKETDLENKLMVAGLGWRGRNSQGFAEGHLGKVHTAILKMDNQQGTIIQHIEHYSVLCSNLDGRGLWGRIDTYICMAETLHCSPEITTTLLIGYTSIQNKMFKQTNKNISPLFWVLSPLVTRQNDNGLKKPYYNHIVITKR